MQFKLPAIIVCRNPVYVNGKELSGVSELTSESVTVTKITDTHVHFFSGCATKVAKRNKYGFKNGGSSNENYYFSDMNVPRGTVVGRNAIKFLEDAAPFLINENVTMRYLHSRDKLVINTKEVDGVFKLNYYAIAVHDFNCTSVLVSPCYAPEERETILHDGGKFEYKGYTFYLEDIDKRPGDFVGTNAEVFCEAVAKYFK